MARCNCFRYSRWKNVKSLLEFIVPAVRDISLESDEKCISFKGSKHKKTAFPKRWQGQKKISYFSEELNFVAMTAWEKLCRAVI